MNVVIIDNSVPFMRGLIKDALSQITYHEQCLQDAVKRLAFVRMVAARCAMKFENEEYCLEKYDNDDPVNSPEDIVSNELGFFIGQIRRHEEGLANAHRRFSQIETVMKRGNYTEFTVADIRKIVDERHAAGVSIYDEGEQIR